MQLIIETKYEPIIITLIESPLIRRWIDFCFPNNAIRQIKLRRRTCGRTRKFIPLHQIVSLYSELKEHINELRNLPFMQELKNKFPIPDVPANFNFDQHWCNQIHNNCFVRVAQHLFANEIDDKILADISIIGGRINDIIHFLEGTCLLTSNRKYVMNNCEHEFLSSIFVKNKEWFRFTDDELQCHSTLSGPFYDVCFSSEILGKSYLLGFLDEDDPSYNSVGPINGTWGNIDIKLDTNRTHIYNSEQFRNWAAIANLDPNSMLLEMPMGSIDEDTRTRLNNSKFQLNGTDAILKIILN